jgi:hypothetical protein
MKVRALVVQSTLPNKINTILSIGPIPPGTWLTAATRWESYYYESVAQVRDLL